ncbi:23337_t:CDS:2 [Gigaspora margarita]|uniref:23337_t:CDS:1 n=1 Tax=Gigaspora margarita TaxID=4874 RepID=A0ABN7UZ87_GIGMA|nr:23337_t:CDS:2 [Gigaspora margarita]
MKRPTIPETVTRNDDTKSDNTKDKFSCSSCNDDTNNNEATFYTENNNTKSCNTENNNIENNDTEKTRTTAPERQH